MIEELLRRCDRLLDITPCHGIAIDSSRVHDIVSSVHVLHVLLPKLSSWMLSPVAGETLSGYRRRLVQRP